MRACSLQRSCCCLAKCRTILNLSLNRCGILSIQLPFCWIPICNPTKFRDVMCYFWNFTFVRTAFGPGILGVVATGRLVQGREPRSSHWELKSYLAAATHRLVIDRELRPSHWELRSYLVAATGRLVIGRELRPSQWEFRSYLVAASRLPIILKTFSKSSSEIFHGIGCLRFSSYFACHGVINDTKC